jgi:gliding motility-associated-like protein
MSQRPFCSTFYSCRFRCRPVLLAFLTLGLFFFHGPVADGQITIQSPSNVAATCGNENGKLIVQVNSVSPTTFVITLTGGTLAPSASFTSASGVTSASNTFTDLGAGVYTITVTDNSGDAQATLSPAEVTNLPGPTNFILGVQSDPTCVNNDGVVNINIQGGTAPYSVSENGSVVATVTSTPAPVSGLASGINLFDVTDANGCPSQSGSESINVPLDNNLTLNMGTAPTICQGTDTTLSIGTNGTSFAWTPAAGLSSTTVEDPVVSPTTSTTYTLRVGLGICTRTGTLDVTVLPAPVPDAGGPDTTCYGKTITLTGSGGVQYTWMPSTFLLNPDVADPLVVDPTSTTTYSLSVIDKNGCKSLRPSYVTLVVLAPYPVFAGNDTSVMVGQTVPLNAVDVAGVGFDAYVWTPVSGLSNPDIADPTASFSAIGVYTYVVTATAPNGCSGSDSVTIKVYALADIFVPSAFTPNNDGHNDLLHALPVSIRDFKYLTVFNRWGQRVFTTTNPGIGWDGTFNGTEMPVGTYVWMAAGVDYTGKLIERKGTVILIR